MRRANTVATLIIGAVLIVSVSVFGVRTFQIGETFQSRQQAYTESAIMLEESLQQSISTLMLRGYNNTAERDGGEIWWCNAATPPDLHEVNRSLTILAEEAVDQLIATLAGAGVSASAPTIHFTFEESISDLEDERVIFNISEFIVELETPDGVQSRNLERTYTYAYRTWLILKALDTWSRCDMGDLSRELEAALNPAGVQCLYDSCCCGGAGDPADLSRITSDNRIDPLRLDEAVENAITKLNDILNGGSCTSPGTDSSGITCFATQSLDTDLHIQQSHDPGYCTTTFSSTCAIRPIGNPVQLDTSQTHFDAYCSDARAPIATNPMSAISGTLRTSGPDIGSAGSDITGTRFAVDKQLYGDITVTCVDEQSRIYRDGRFRDLTAIVRLGVAIYQDCDIDLPLGPQTDYSSYVCLDGGGGGGGGGGGCVMCEGACEPAPQCSIEGLIYTPICDASMNQIIDANGDPVCDYRSCEDLDCVGPLTCCGDILDIPITCIPGSGCTYTEDPNAACEEYIANLPDPSVCEPEGEGEGEGDGEGEEGEGEGEEGEGDGEPETEVGPCAEGGAGKDACPGIDCQEAKCVPGNDQCEYDPKPDDSPCGSGLGDFCSDRLCRAGSCEWVADNENLGEECQDPGLSSDRCSWETYTCQMSGSRASCLRDTSIPEPVGTPCRTYANGCTASCNGAGSCTVDTAQSCTTNACGETFEGTCTTSGSCTTSYESSRCCGGSNYCDSDPFFCCDGSCETQACAAPPPPS